LLRVRASLPPCSKLACCLCPPCSLPCLVALSLLRQDGAVRSSGER
jgi:hypothetical protein